MISTICDIVTSIINFFISFVNMVGADILFIFALGVEVVFVVFFLIKSSMSYEASLNRSLDKLNYWLFEKKVVNEENIRELNMLFKTKAPKRLCYYWQQYILFREDVPSSYLSSENLVEKPLKTSSYNSSIKNLSLFTTIWAFVVGVFMLLASASGTLLGSGIAQALIAPIFIAIIGLIFIVIMRSRKNSMLNALYQNVSLFGRFMDNACVDLPSYIDYQILFTPAEIEKGQPVLREFLDFKARKEKEEFNKAKIEEVYETYDFSSTGVDGSIVLDRAMKESELYLKKKEKILVQVSQLEAELDSRRKNFDNTQKDYQTKIQASKENVARLRQMQEETTNRIESNFYRKQQTQEIAKQEQYEQEFEQLRAKYLIEKNDCEEEINKLNKELEDKKNEVQNVMIGEYQTFFDKFCHSAEKVVGEVFAEKFDQLKQENELNKQYITELEIRLKNIPQGEYDAAPEMTAQEAEQPVAEQVVENRPVFDDVPPEGKYDEFGNYLYPNGTYYDVDGNFHDEFGNVYTQDGTLISQAPVIDATVETPVENTEYAPQGEEFSLPEAEPVVEEKKIVNFDDFDDFDYMTDVSQKGAIYGIAENIINDIDNDVEVVNNTKPAVEKTQEVETQTQEVSLEEKKIVDDNFDDFDVPQNETISAEDIAKQPVEDETPKKRPGRPRKIVQEEEQQPAKKRGRPRKVVEEVKPVEKKKPGRPKKVVETAPAPVVEEKKKPGRPKKEVAETPVVEKKKPGRPKKIVNVTEEESTKRGRGRPKKIDSIMEINKKLSAEEAKLNEMRQTINQELEVAMADLDSKTDGKSRRDELIKQIDKLQKEAQAVIKNHESETRIAEINSRLESLLQEIQNLN